MVLSYVADDHGDSNANATAIGSAKKNLQSGVITTTEDVDLFLTEARPGLYIFRPNPSTRVQILISVSR